MKIKARPDDAGVPEVDEWFQMNDWLAALKDGGRAEPAADHGAGVPADHRAGPQDAGRPGPPARHRAGPPADLWTKPAPDHRSGPPADLWAEPAPDDRSGPPASHRARPPAGQRGGSRPDASAALPSGPVAVATTAARAGAAGRPGAAPAQVTVRAVIGDRLRMPIVWCEMVSCVSWHADPASLGEADVRARAIAAGWRVDALGLLACPGCQQTAPGFRSPSPVALWDRDKAMTMAAQMTAAPGGEPAADPGDQAAAPGGDLSAAPGDDVTASGAGLAASPGGDAGPIPAGGDGPDVHHSADGEHPASDRRPASSWLPASGRLPGGAGPADGDRPASGEPGQPPASRPGPGRHRKRAAAKTASAS